MEAQAQTEDSVEHSRVIHWLVVLTAVLLTRFSWAPSYLWTDTVNLAYALQSFDPTTHQPHPPGYPLFVALARFVRVFTPTNGIAFWIISVAVTAASALMLYHLAKRMASQWAAVAAVMLFIINPVLWFARLRSPLRPWLALISLIVAYCAWRCWKGERTYAFYGALALGIGAGFRPDVLAYLLPLWCVTAWVSTRSWRVLALGGGIIAGFAALWFGIVVVAMGGWTEMLRTVTGYLREQSQQDSLIFAESIRTWLRPLSRLVVWNALALIGWIWAPIIGYRYVAARNLPWSFLLIWLVPGLLCQVLFHVAAPGHTLFATPVWCLIGGCTTFAMGRFRDVILAVAIMVNAALFLNAIPLGYPPSPQASLMEKAWMSARNSIAFGTFETSQERLRWWEEMTEVSLKELSRFSSTERPTVIVALNGNDREFDFINWRVVSYYVSQPLWVLMDNVPSDHDSRVRRVFGKDVEVMNESTITLPRSARVLWVLFKDGTFHRKLERVVPVHNGRYILYSDIPSDLNSLEIDGFSFTFEDTAN